MRRHPEHKDQPLPRGREEHLGREGRGDSVTRCPWPDVDSALIDPAIVERVNRKFDVIRAVRNLRKEHNIPLGAPVSVVVKPASPDEKGILEAGKEECLVLMRAREMLIDANYAPQKPMPTAPTSSGTVVYVDLEGVVDSTAQADRLREEIKEIDGAIESVERELANGEFLKKAPAKVVEMRRKKKDQLLERRMKVQKSLDQLKAR